MQFTQRKKRVFWVNSFIGLIPDATIGVATAYSTDSGIPGFFITIIGLQVVYFLLWIKNTLWQWAFFQIRGKRLMVEHIETFLKANNFPAPKDYEDSIEGYLASLIENDGLEPELRIKATAELAALKYPMNNFRMQEGLRYTMAYEEALSNYKKRFEGHNS